MTLLTVGIFFIVYTIFSRPKLPPDADKIIDTVLANPLPEIIKGKAGYVTSNGIRIWYENILPTSKPKGTIVLIMANGGNALDWPRDFVDTFVGSGYQVIRYDNRSTGMSDYAETHGSLYTLADMAEDALAIVDTLKIKKVHVIGLSMGGMIAQEFAAKHPERSTSLTLMSTSGFVGDPALPGISSGYVIGSLFKSLPLLKYRIFDGEKNLIKERIAKLVINGYQNLDIKKIAEVVLYDLRKRRGVSIKGALQHQKVVASAGSRYKELKKLTVPTLIIHGKADQIIPFAHGQKIASVIPSSQTMWLEETGHAFPYPTMEKVSEKILSFIQNKALSGSGDLVAEIKRLSKNESHFVVALDGRSGSGKSTISKELADGLRASVIDQDDFYAGGSMEDWSHLSAKQKADHVIDWKRVKNEALEPLLADKVAKWHPFDWEAMEGLSTDVIVCRPSKIIILDGAYSSRPELAGLIDLTVLVQLRDDVRRQRLMKREGEDFVLEWHKIWTEAEEYYFTNIRPPSTFDIVIDRPVEQSA